MSRRRRSGGIVAALLAALSVGACADKESEPCTQADLDRPAPATMPGPVEIARTRRLNGDRLGPLPAGTTPRVSPDTAWNRLRAVRPGNGGGNDELLLGLFTGRGYARVPAWVLFSSHVAQRLEPLSGHPEVEPKPDQVCGFVDVLTVLNADTGERFYGSTVTSAGPARRPATSTAPRPSDQ